MPGSLAEYVTVNLRNILSDQESQMVLSNIDDPVLKNLWQNFKNDDTLLRNGVSDFIASNQSKEDPEKEKVVFVFN